jgi:hypothetical protein
VGTRTDRTSSPPPPPPIAVEAGPRRREAREPFLAGWGYRPASRRSAFRFKGNDQLRPGRLGSVRRGAALSDTRQMCRSKGTLPMLKSAAQLMLVSAALMLAGCDNNSFGRARRAAHGPVTMTMSHTLPDGPEMTFRLPKGYYAGEAGRADNPVEFSVRWKYPSGAGAGLHTQWSSAGRSKDVIEVVLSPYGTPQFPTAAKDVKENHLSDSIYSYQDKNVALGERYCGYDLYDSPTTSWPPISRRGVEVADPRPLLPSPLDHARLFAHSTAQGRYDLIVICAALPPDGWCRASTSFEGWRLVTYASGTHLCDFPELVARSQALIRSALIEQ